MVLEHGMLPELLDRAERRIAFVEPTDHEGFLDLLRDHNIGAFVFTSSVRDKVPLRLARSAAAAGLLTVHVLDNWTGYRTRMEMDGSAFEPTIYTAIDQLSREAAIGAGIASASLHVVGQPALASLTESAESWAPGKRAQALEAEGFDPGRILLLFVSEPVSADQGDSAASPLYRGYTEKDVLRSFCQALQDSADRVHVALLPHPREDVNGLESLWNEVRGALSGKIVKVEEGRKTLFPADGVIGMASILLYEAWLLGKPVVSLQPGLRLDPLRMLQHRTGAVFIDQAAPLAEKLRHWLKTVSVASPLCPHPDMALHRGAAAQICALIDSRAEEKRGNGPFQV